MNLRSLAPLLALAAAGACAGGADDGADAGDASATEAPAETGDPGVRMHIVLTGGPHAGTYEASPAGSECLDYQSGGVDGLGIAYYAGSNVHGIASIDFGTKAKVPTAGSIDRFGFTVGIGDGTEDMANMMGVPYRVRPEQQQGTGTATVSGTAPRYTVRVSGTTAEGVGVEATLECLR